MRPDKVDRPLPVIFIASFQFLKAAFLLTVAAFLWLAPDALPNSVAFTHVLFIAAHGKDLSGFLVPVFGCYLIYVGVGLLNLRTSVRTTLALSSAITVCVSLYHLGVFSDDGIRDPQDRETLYILILLDLAIYIYLTFHPEITSTFKRPKKRTIPLHS